MASRLKLRIAVSWRHNRVGRPGSEFSAASPAKLSFDINRDDQDGEDRAARAALRRPVDLRRCVSDEFVDGVGVVDVPGTLDPLEPESSQHQQRGDQRGEHPGQR